MTDSSTARWHIDWISSSQLPACAERTRMAAENDLNNQNRSCESFEYPRTFYGSGIRVGQNVNRWPSYPQIMSSKLEAGADGKQLAGPRDDEQSPSPVPSSISKTAVGDKGHHASTDKPYSVFTHKEKWLIVCLASCTATFR